MKIRKKILDYEYEEVLETKYRELIRVGCAVAGTADRFAASGSHDTRERRGAQRIRQLQPSQRLPHRAVVAILGIGHGRGERHARGARAAHRRHCEAPFFLKRDGRRNPGRRAPCRIARTRPGGYSNPRCLVSGLQSLILATRWVTDGERKARPWLPNLPSVRPLQ